MTEENGIVDVAPQQSSDFAQPSLRRVVFLAVRREIMIGEAHCANWVVEATVRCWQKRFPQMRAGVILTSDGASVVLEGL
jgi:hypothetical protein